MKSADLVDQLAGWIQASHPAGGPVRTLHCFRVWKSVPIPSLGEVAVISVRHQVPLASRAPELLVVELWGLCSGEVGDADVARICAQLATVRAWYDEILEDAEVEGRRRVHRLSVHANLVGDSIAFSPLIDALSLHGREVAFWTSRIVDGTADFMPHVREARSVAPSALAAMLDHLPWAAPPVQVQTAGDGTSPPILLATR
jgi:hypothetical protein